MTSIKSSSTLSSKDRLLPVLILIAIGLGLLLGNLAPNLPRTLGRVSFDGTSIPILVGLFVMMYPILAKVRVNQARYAVSQTKVLVTSVVLNWVIGPALMFGLAWAFFPHTPGLRDGIILVGLARCIAMVLVWNNLARGDEALGVALVALNSLFQVLFFGVLTWWYLVEFPHLLGLATSFGSISFVVVISNVALYLALPFVASVVVRSALEKRYSATFYDNKYLKAIAPFSLYGLLFTIVALFALQGHAVTGSLGQVAEIAIPYLIYFAVMWSVGYLSGVFLRLGHQVAVTLAFTGAGNNFELAIALAISIYGATSTPALAAIVGPLIEVPALVGLVRVALALEGTNLAQVKTKEIPHEHAN